jgi:hypothetical protein
LFHFNFPQMYSRFEHTFAIIYTQLRLMFIYFRHKSTVLKLIYGTDATLYTTTNYSFMIKHMYNFAQGHIILCMSLIAHHIENVPYKSYGTCVLSFTRVYPKVSGLSR